MRTRILLGTALAAVVAIPAAAQDQVRTVERRMAVEGDLRAQPMKAPVMDVRVTPGRPYSGDAVTEFVQVLSDGNRITRRTVTRTYRDNEGRTRREQTAADDVVHVMIVDPVAHTSIILEPATRIAWKQQSVAALAARPGAAGTGGAWVGAARARTPATEAERRETETTARVALAENARAMSGELKKAAERAASGEGTSTKEDLGTRTIEGVLAEGSRTTTVIEAGSIGNEQPIRIVSEQWFSPDLQVFVMTKHSDPRSGETTYRLTNLVRGEPDRSLFEVPADYTVKEATIRMRERLPGQ